MTYAIEIRNLNKRYSDFILDNVNFSIPSGCIMGFIGENGAGKSTTIKLILDLVHRDSGHIAVLGCDDLAKNQDLKEHIGVIFDESDLPDNLNAREIDMIMKNCFKTWDSGAFSKYISMFSLPAKKTVKEYSRGMRKKLSIAVALSHDVRLLILDEATSGLDPIMRDEILDVFLDFIQDENHSILISSHILSDLEKICDYITFIHKGKIIFSEEKDVLRDQYTLIKCSESEYDRLDKAAIVGERRSSYGIEALALKNKIGRNIQSDPATIEDIMLYFARENRS